VIGWAAAKGLMPGDPPLSGSTPTLSLPGGTANDPWQVPIGDGFEYARRLGAKLRLIADCGHLLIVERPDVCARAALEFFDVG